MKRAGMRGVTVMELMVVVALSGIVTGMAGFTAQGIRERFAAEQQVREMYRDMVNARIRAFERKRAHFVLVTTNGYQIAEDTNESGGTMPDPGDMTLWSAPKQFKFDSLWNGTVIMDKNGIISKSGDPILTTTALSIWFDTAGNNPEYDCISAGPTRISEGRWDGRQCVAR